MHPTELTVHDYVDNALVPAERVKVDRHLESCAACRGLIADLRELRRATATLQPMEPPQQAWARIQHRIREGSLADEGPSEAGLYGRRSWMWLAAAAVVLLAAFVGVRFWAPAGHPAAPPNGVAAPGSDGREIAESVESELLQAEQHYQNAIAGLEQ